MASPCEALTVGSGPAIRFGGVSLSLGRTAVLDGVDFTVEAGTVHAIVGPNGGGKSSLVRCLLGQAPYTGTITLDWPSAAGVIGYVPQTLEFDRGLPMTVMDFMTALTTDRPVFFRHRAANAQAILEALGRVGMAGLASRHMGALSGGERQRVLIAQALVPEPGLVVLDEPMAALDEAGTRAFEALLADLTAAGVTVLWVEHDLAAIRRLAMRVTALDRRVLFEGGPLSVLTPERVLGLFSRSRGQR